MMPFLLLTNVAGMSQEKVSDEILKYYVIFVYFQAAVSALLAVSVLYVEKKIKMKYYVIFRDFVKYLFL